MISRLSARAAAFAILATATLAYATGAHQSGTLPAAAAHAVRVVQLDTVVITAQRLPQAQR